MRLGDPELQRELFRKPGGGQRPDLRRQARPGGRGPSPSQFPGLRGKEPNKGTLRPSLICYEMTEESGQGETPVP